MQIVLRNGRATWKQDWAEIGGKRNFYRSRWEYRYALYLEFMNIHFILKVLRGEQIIINLILE